MEAFISQPHVKLKERMSGRLVKSQAGAGSVGGLAFQAFPSYTYIFFYYSSRQKLCCRRTCLGVGAEAHATQGHPHLWVVQKLKQHGLQSSGRETKQQAPLSQHAYLTFPRRSQIIIGREGLEPGPPGHLVRPTLLQGSHYLSVFVIRMVYF